MVCSHSFDRIRRLSCYFSVGALPADLRAARFAGPETRIRLRAVAQKGRYMLQLKEIRKEYKTGDLEHAGWISDIPAASGSPQSLPSWKAPASLPVPAPG